MATGLLTVRVAMVADRGVFGGFWLGPDKEAEEGRTGWSAKGAVAAGGMGRGRRREGWCEKGKKRKWGRWKWGRDGCAEMRGMTVGEGCRGDLWLQWRWGTAEVRT
ncbi:hypothetical protein OIU74_011150 [Salix koriyanagi]|uniref:Uncharacterized protein n=1 Tax=Salix koriyanagi TaxID=2511006 RepID=A0A9Q0YU12_9ROSI|nr:hypothetical protein OIU74_011150 [Salix koriyanagi]